MLNRVLIMKGEPKKQLSFYNVTFFTESSPTYSVPD